MLELSIGKGRRVKLAMGYAWGTVEMSYIVRGVCALESSSSTFVHAHTRAHTCTHNLEMTDDMNGAHTYTMTY